MGNDWGTKKCARCPEPATHEPCCSSHGHSLCCECYCTTHFVEVDRCKCGGLQKPEPTLEAELERMERGDPEVAAARASYDRMVDGILGRGPHLSSEEIQRIYGAPGSAPD